MRDHTEPTPQLMTAAAAPLRSAAAGALAGADAERAWAAVQARDASWDGRFVYAVASTGIYCRPSCASRRPGRGRVTFFAQAGAAEAAGYRPCRRCRPLHQGAPEAEVRVAAARAYLDGHLDETVTLERLGREVGLSPYH